MYPFAIYEEQSGKVLRVGRHARPRGLALERRNLNAGEAIYLGEIDPTKTILPGGFPAAKPDEPVTVTADEVKQWAGRILSYTDWLEIRSINGAPVPDDIATYRQAVRDRSGEIETMSPIPADFRDPKWWPEEP